MNKLANLKQHQICKQISHNKKKIVEKSKFSGIEIPLAELQSAI